MNPRTHELMAPVSQEKRHSRRSVKQGRILRGWTGLLLCALLGSAQGTEAVAPAELASPGPRITVVANPGLLKEAPLNTGFLQYAQAPASLGEGEPSPARNGAGSIAVIYPDIAEPYRSVFTQIIDGIEAATGASVPAHAIGAQVDTAELNAQLKRNGTRVVIALGRQGLKATSGLDRDITVVAGGVLLLPEAEQRSLVGISLTPDPGLLFARLKSLQPATRRVLVVYDPRHNEWLIRLARDAARTHGMELLAYEARDLASAARLYETIFATTEARRDAVWLPQDPTTVDEGTILPMVLRESWNRNMTVFSSSYLHVKKGALFVLYPNNVELGRSLAMSAVRILVGEPRKGMLPLRDVHVAVNLRTANHIGLNITYQQQRSFSAVFPEQ
jgi:putative ABC transport system substrate-binding protein